MPDGTTDEVMVRAASTVRAYLEDLLPESERAAYDEQLLAVLRRAGEEDVEDELDRLLESQPRVNDWVAGFLEFGLPADSLRYVERGARPPGEPAPLALPELYVCPVDGIYAKFLRLAYESPGTCPDHPGTVLVLAPETRA
ncbi:hypothetical protein [Micromonospora saelicesensis]|uniref:Uncharacterized protein n=1 Tax=Micromonospora saelicesensis TaxID=285676 RepID=A0A1C4Z3A1_9ACTN|nr:hypothetical protein [Micromonospora saelicesensis]RAO42616.1 hypothetical protein GAR06_05142 [Micromonospora saelicesensis]RAO42832.1 hypothetical protein PSN01_06084 [Micromonospora saelicesensis]SCF27374.1 hypothetical protein GA0070561_4867 [Micromonospora saelicesensis]